MFNEGFTTLDYTALDAKSLPIHYKQSAIQEIKAFFVAVIGRLTSSSRGPLV